MVCVRRSGTQESSIASVLPKAAKDVRVLHYLSVQVNYDPLSSTIVLMVWRNSHDIWWLGHCMAWSSSARHCRVKMSRTNVAKLRNIDFRCWKRAASCFVFVNLLEDWTVSGTGNFDFGENSRPKYYHQLSCRWSNRENYHPLSWKIWKCSKWMIVEDSWR